MKFKIIIHRDDESKIVSVSPNTKEQIISSPNKEFLVTKEEKEDFEKRGFNVEVLAEEK
jgi:hypothetical protein